MNFETMPQPKEEKSGEKPVSRREFLKMAGGAAAAGAVSKLEKAAAALENPVEQNYRDWQAMQKTIETNNARANATYIKNTFGGAADTLLYKTMFDLQLVDSIADKERAEDLRKSDNGRKMLEEAARNYNRFWNAAAIAQGVKEREKKEGLSARVEGFEAAGISNETFRQKMEAKFNKTWLYRNVSAFRYKDEERRQKHFGIAATAEGRGLEGILVKHERQVVQVYKHEGMENNENMLKVIAHEIGHHNDWESSSVLSIHERLQFLKEIAEQFQKPNRFHSIYIDADIPNEYRGKGIDPGVIKYRQVTEYWATLMENYATNPEMLKEHPDDYALADKWYKRLTQL